MRYLLLSLLPLVLTQCVDPYGNPMSPFGPTAPPPYSDGREQYRTDMREHDRNQAQQAYDRGLRDGSDDARSGLPQDNRRNPFGYSTPQARAYTDGYDQGYRSSAPARPPEFTSPPSYPGYQPPAPPSQSPQQSNDPSYSQGYEYGLRDRVAGRQPDAGAHVGRYDPRFRRSFERGYLDAFEARR